MDQHIRWCACDRGIATRISFRLSYCRMAPVFFPRTHLSRSRMHRWVFLVASHPRFFLRPEPRPFLPPIERQNRRLSFRAVGFDFGSIRFEPGSRKGGIFEDEGFEHRHGSIDEPGRSHDDPSEGLGFDRALRTVDDVWRICASQRGWNARRRDVDALKEERTIERPSVVAKVPPGSTKFLPWSTRRVQSVGTSLGDGTQDLLPPCHQQHVVKHVAEPCNDEGP